MKPTIEYLRDTFKYSYEVFKDSREEAEDTWNLYHNRHFTREQLFVLANRGQPAETFNVIKMFSRMIVGYYSTVINTAVVSPKHFRDITTASILNDIVDYTFASNRFKTIEGDKVKLSALISGLLVTYVDVKPTDEKDEFGRVYNNIELYHVPDSEVLLDPMSRADDYSDARFLHRYKWMPEETVLKLFGKAKVDELEAYYNSLPAREADFEHLYGQRFSGEYRIADNYLIVHTVLEDDEGKRWSIMWNDRIILEKKEITFKEVRWPYRVERVHSSDKAEYYGVFHEIRASQHALNQAVLKIQQLVNSNKVFVEHTAIESLEDFETAYNRVTGVIPVLKLSGVKPFSNNADVQQQYMIVNECLNRMQKVLGINDSFLGMAFASDSGRKVKLQQNATIMSLRYMTARVESFYELLAYDIAKLAQQYYKAHQFIRLTDDVTGQRWVELNRPYTEQSLDESGQVVENPILLPEVDPANGEFKEDEHGNIILGPVVHPDSDFEFTKFEVEIDASAYNDDDEKAQSLLETVMGGPIGSMMTQVNPAAYFQMASLAVKSMKTRYAPNVAAILEETSQMLMQNQGQNQQVAAANLGSQAGYTGGPGTPSDQAIGGEV